MLSARATGFWGQSYEITLDGQPITTFKAKSWGTGVRFSLGGLDHELRSNGWGNRYEVLTGGVPVAVADAVGRKHWTVTADGRTYTFERVSMWSNDQALMADGERVGLVKRTSTWKTDASAELPTLPLPVQVFVLAVVVTKWNADSSAAAAAT